MTARILETNSTPLSRIDVEGVTVDLIENALGMLERRWTRFYFGQRCLPALESRAIASR